MFEKIFAYCERGLDPAFWAEPLNAISNAAFWIASIAGLRLVDAKNLREVTLFPMNQQAQDLLMSAPADVAPSLLRELGLRTPQPRRRNS